MKTWNWLPTFQYTLVKQQKKRGERTQEPPCLVKQKVWGLTRAVNSGFCREMISFHPPGSSSMPQGSLQGWLDGTSKSTGALSKCIQGLCSVPCHLATKGKQHTSTLMTQKRAAAFLQNLGPASELGSM